MSLISCDVLFAGALSVGTMEYGSKKQTDAQEHPAQFFELLFNCYQMVMNKKEKGVIIGIILEKQDDFYGINGA